MGHQHRTRVIKVTVEQAEAWWADIEGGHSATAPSLAALRRRVLSTIGALPEPYDGPVEIEWSYVLADGGVQEERQRLTADDLRPPSETAARVGWYQQRVDDYLRQRRQHRRVDPSADPES